MGRDPVVFLHGNPASSYLWRDVMPHAAPFGRCIALDLIGMGDSEKLDDSGPGRYRFVEHRAFLDGALDALGVASNVVWVVHDWGSALGFDWANRHRGTVWGIAYIVFVVRAAIVTVWIHDIRIRERDREYRRGYKNGYEQAIREHQEEKQ